MITCDGMQGNLITASKMLPSMKDVMEREFSVKSRMRGEDLRGATYRNVFCPGNELPFIASSHVTMDRGTGLVHTAPSHGHDDYNIGLKHHLHNVRNYCLAFLRTHLKSIHVVRKFQLEWDLADTKTS